ncbi:MAG TPA: hypothetical protein VEA37_15005, partial [Flavobacterium sp.]|nr:hypothetical protein [Flavobacterium sp.]
MTKINILGVEVNSLTQEQFKNEIEQILQKDFDQSHLLATTYSEFIVAAQTDLKFRDILNQAYLNVADGIGVLWAASFLARSYKNLGQ